MLVAFLDHGQQQAENLARPSMTAMFCVRHADRECAYARPPQSSNPRVLRRRRGRKRKNAAQVRPRKVVGANPTRTNRTNAGQKNGHGRQLKVTAKFAAGLGRRWRQGAAGTWHGTDGESPSTFMFEETSQGLKIWRSSIQTTRRSQCSGRGLPRVPFENPHPGRLDSK